MKFDLKSMYTFLISHTFPGFIVLVELVMYIDWFLNSGFASRIASEIGKHQLASALIGYLLSTMLGIFIDGISHLLFDDLFREQMRDYKFTALYDDLSVNIYKHFLEEDLWYFYECYSNMSIALFLGSPLLSRVIHCNPSSIFMMCSCAPYVLCAAYDFIVLVLFAEACYTHRRFALDEMDFIEASVARRTIVI
jgi:hypothetical protein